MTATLSTFRIALDLSQAELATRAGIRRATLSQIERGTRAHPQARTIANIAQALHISPEICRAAINTAVHLAAQRVQHSKTANETAEEHAFRHAGWTCMRGLDRDLAIGLSRELLVLWTHNSTTLEGNTLSKGETLAVLTTGITVSGKSLREHSEIHGHSNAISLLSQLCSTGKLTISHIHELHRVIQTGVTMDIFAPVGAWKVEQNGCTTAHHGWHEYAQVMHVPALMDAWLKLYISIMQTFKKKIAEATKTSITKTPVAPALHAFCVASYIQLHIAFTRIHPYADGNGRLARLLANLPLLVNGFPPLTIDASQRHDYIALLSANDHLLGTLTPNTPLYETNAPYTQLLGFATQSWAATQSLVATYHARQRTRAQT